MNWGLSLNKYIRHADLCPLQIWDIVKGQIQQVCNGHQKEVYALHFSRDGHLIISGSGDNTIQIWDLCHKFHKVLTIGHNSNPQPTSVSLVVFAGPVCWTGKKTKIKLNPTAKDQTTSCSCTNSEFFQLPVATFVEKSKNRRKLV